MSVFVDDWIHHTLRPRVCTEKRGGPFWSRFLFFLFRTLPSGLSLSTNKQKEPRNFKSFCVSKISSVHLPYFVRLAKFKFGNLIIFFLVWKTEKNFIRCQNFQFFFFTQFPQVWNFVAAFVFWVGKRSPGPRDTQGKQKAEWPSFTTSPSLPNNNNNRRKKKKRLHIRNVWVLASQAT